MTTSNSLFYLEKEEPIKGCLLAMRDCILACDEAVSETKKYGMPCFCFKGKAFCYLWTDKKTEEPYYLFVEGKHLDHPNLESGHRARMKVFRINPIQDLPVTTLNAVFQQALNLYKNGTIKIKK